jgi:hypothetical protein
LGGGFVVGFFLFLFLFFWGSVLLIGLILFVVLFCFISFFCFLLSSVCHLCIQYCQFLWIIDSWLHLRFSLTFIANRVMFVFIQRLSCWQ